MQKFFIYPIYTAALLVIMVAIVPKKQIRQLAPYAILLGSVFELLVLVTMTLLFNLAGHKNFGPFGAFSIPFFPPIAWCIFFVMYFYILPKNEPWTRVFPFISALFSSIFSNVLVNLDIFYINYHPFIVPYGIYLVWHYTATMIFLHLASTEAKGTDMLSP